VVFGKIGQISKPSRSAKKKYNYVYFYVGITRKYLIIKTVSCHAESKDLNELYHKIEMCYECSMNRRRTSDSF
jgi:hypothetical protein